ncbi:cytochrome P450 [Actinophytocola oryzae]|uniref:Cytochrome P450 n=1 Tax=Actinophytocola oryzae TaxID=502181 RepID=A0A4V3FUZ9_9PSEU|nr:cytochrome P450 [Actinophytocola oryzae]TDV57151.1 cytochrome P450 [Actinophytocola oryzae]
MQKTESFPPRACPFHGDGSTTEPGPLKKVTLRGGQEVWAASRHADVRAVLTDPAFSSNRAAPNFPNPTGRRIRRDERFKPTLIMLDPPEHGPARRAVLGEFTVKRLAALGPRIQQIVDEHLDAMLAKESRTADLVAEFALPVPSLVICELLGVPYADHDFFQSASKTLLSQKSTTDEVRAAADALRDYLDKLVTAKEADPTDDLIGRQIARYGPDRADDHDALVSLSVLLLIAGHETTANMISLGTVALLQHPDQVEALRADPSKTPGAVEELLREFTIAEFVTSRVAVADTVVGGVEVKAGEGVLTLGNAANHDPAVFSDPERIDVTRGARNHIAFGYGAHQCLGQNLARVELQVVFDTMFRRVPTLRVDAPMSELSFKDDATVYGLHSLPVSW